VNTDKDGDNNNWDNNNGDLYVRKRWDGLGHVWHLDTYKLLDHLLNQLPEGTVWVLQVDVMHQLSNNFCVRI
jgi:hypothetical protein